MIKIILDVDDPFPVSRSRSILSAKKGYKLVHEIGICLKDALVTLPMLLLK